MTNTKCFYFGEIGFQAEGDFITLSAAEDAAVEHSIAMGDSAIAVWNESDEVLSVVVEGQIFDKRVK